MPWQEPLGELQKEVEAVEKRLDEEVDRRFFHIDALLEDLQHKLVTRWLIAIIGLLIAAGGIYYVAHRADSAGTQAKLASRQTQQLVYEQAVVRHDTILNQCIDQNQRNMQTIAVFKQEANRPTARLPRPTTTNPTLNAVVQYLRTYEQRIGPAQLRFEETLVNALAPSVPGTSRNPNAGCIARANRTAPIPKLAHH